MNFWNIFKEPFSLTGQIWKTYPRMFSFPNCNSNQFVKENSSFFRPNFPEIQIFLEFADKGLTSFCFWKNILDVQNNDEAKIYIDQT